MVGRVVVDLAVQLTVQPAQVGRRVVLLSERKGIGGGGQGDEEGDAARGHRGSSVLREAADGRPRNGMRWDNDWPDRDKLPVGGPGKLGKPGAAVGRIDSRHTGGLFGYGRTLRAGQR